MRLILLVACVGAVVLSAVPSRAQFVQYTPSGDFVSPAEEREKVFERAMERARWRWGHILVDPWLYLRDLGYEDNQSSGATGGGRVSDFTVSAGAGLNTYMTVGSDFIWGTFLLPEYTWWQDLEERNRLNGRYGTGLFGNMGRLGVELTGTRFDQSSVFSREVEERVSQRSDKGALSLTLDIGSGFLLFADAQASTYESLEDDPSLSAFQVLDRDETIYRGGFGYRSPQGFRVGVGFESSEVEFDPTSAVDRSNSGTSITLDFMYDGPQFLLNGLVASRSIDREFDSVFVPYDDFTGSLQISRGPIGPAHLEAFAHKSVAYSIQADVGYLEEESAGASIRFELGERGNLRFFGEAGDITFVEIVSDGTPRIDDRTSYGVDLSLIFKRFSWSLRVSQDDYDSSLPEFDRDFTRFSTNVSFGSVRTSPWG